MHCPLLHCHEKHQNDVSGLTHLPTSKYVKMFFNDFRIESWLWAKGRALLHASRLETN